MGEIRDAILKIVKSDPEIGNALEAAKVPGKIRSRRGIAYISDDGTVKTKKVTDPDNGENTGAPGAGQETDPENPSGDSANAPGDTSGGGGGGGNTGSMDDIHNGAELGIKDSKATGLDSDGNAASISFDSICGAEYAPPAGWSDPDTAPEPAGYEAGTYFSKYAVNPIGITYGFDPYSCAQAHVDALNANGGSVTLVDVFSVTNDNWSANVLVGGSPSVVENIGRNQCGGGHDPSYCANNTPYWFDTNHPSDGVCSIAYDCSAGGFKGHAKDPDCGANQVVAKNALYIKDTVSGQWYRVTKLANGGTKTTPVTDPTFDGSGNVTGGGAPESGLITVVRDSGGKPIGFYDSASQQYVQ